MHFAIQSPFLLPHPWSSLIVNRAPQGPKSSLRISLFHTQDCAQGLALPDVCGDFLPTSQGPAYISITVISVKSCFELRPG